MSVRIASGHFPCLQQLHLTSRDTCKFVPTSMHCLIHLHRTSIHIWYSHIQPSVLSVALATDQRNSSGCYNCTGQAGLHQPAVKMVMTICSIQIPYSCFCIDTIHCISIFFCKFYPSFQLTFFPHIYLKRLVLWSNTLSQSYQWYHPFSIPCHLSLHFLKKCFPKEGTFMRIIWNYGIIRSGQKWFGNCMLHGLMDAIPRTKTKTLPFRKISLLFFLCSIS